MVSVNDYEQERTCDYKGEKYLVRDNGAVMRLTPEGKKPRPLDNTWTFGKKNDSNGYMTIGGHRVHIIVATAFYGPKDSTVYVVDHRDTNRCNNRPENLRWLTKLENVLQNDITRHKIENIFGSVENFLKNPSLLRYYESQDINFKWMKTVTKEEAENTLKSWKALMEKPNVKSERSEPIGEWIYENKEHISSTSYEGKLTYEGKSSGKKDGIILIEENKKEIQSKRDIDKAEKAKQKREEKKATKEAILAAAKAHGWSLKKNVVGNGWRADFVIEAPEGRLGVILSRSTKNYPEFHMAMNAEGIKDCWLGDTYHDFGDDNLYPCFDVEIKESNVNAILSEKLSIPIDELLCAMLSNRLQIKNYISVQKLKIRFMPYTCYFCGFEHYIYMVIGFFSEGFPSLETYKGLHDSSLTDEELEFKPVIIKSVEDYLSKHPELHYLMGNIKDRLSKTRNDAYMSFGCPNCDGLDGDYYISKYKACMVYKPDDENVHIIDVSLPGMRIPYKNWIVV